MSLLEGIILVLHCHIHIVPVSTFFLLDLHRISYHYVEMIDIELETLVLFPVCYVNLHLSVQEELSQFLILSHTLHWRHLDPKYQENYSHSSL